MRRRHHVHGGVGAGKERTRHLVGHRSIGVDLVVDIAIVDIAIIDTAVDIAIIDTAVDVTEVIVVDDDVIFESAPFAGQLSVGLSGLAVWQGEGP